MAKFQPTEYTIVVTGLEDVSRAFGRIDTKLKGSLRKSLVGAAEPVKARADALGPERIRNLHVGDPWSRNRIGVTQRTVYVAPVERGRSRNPKSKRPNFKALMLERAYEPALEEKSTEIRDRLGGLLDDIADAWRL